MTSFEGFVKKTSKGKRATIHVVSFTADLSKIVNASAEALEMFAEVAMNPELSKGLRELAALRRRAKAS